MLIAFVTALAILLGDGTKVVELRDFGVAVLRQNEILLTINKGNVRTTTFDAERVSGMEYFIRKIGPVAYTTGQHQNLREGFFGIRMIAQKYTFWIFDYFSWKCKIIRGHFLRVFNSVLHHKPVKYDSLIIGRYVSPNHSGVYDDVHRRRVSNIFLIYSEASMHETYLAGFFDEFYLSNLDPRAVLDDKLVTRQRDNGSSGRGGVFALSQGKGDIDHTNSRHDGLDGGDDEQPESPYRHRFLGGEIALLVIAAACGFWVAYQAFREGRDGRPLCGVLGSVGLLLMGGVIAGYAVLMLLISVGSIT